MQLRNVKLNNQKYNIKTTTLILQLAATRTKDLSSTLLHTPSSARGNSRHLQPYTVKFSSQETNVFIKQSVKSPEHRFFPQNPPPCHQSQLPASPNPTMHSGTCFAVLLSVVVVSMTSHLIAYAWRFEHRSFSDQRKDWPDSIAAMFQINKTRISGIAAYFPLQVREDVASSESLISLGTAGPAKWTRDQFQSDPYQAQTALN
ncbi:hypothetical protein RRG08_058048 [Elysia crispata]|uniref:Uncharacterized protein n=1 Tax=Elysia crispata TaxID=231223 RepID=A0AAE1A7Z0_9GAST|nr:hypothetical protein RRG08_058048 [Elysia crispata]